jgi:hypothetical protein
MWGPWYTCRDNPPLLPRKGPHPAGYRSALDTSATRSRDFVKKTLRRRITVTSSVNEISAGKYTANTLYRKFETNISRNETVRPSSQFIHSCICEKFIYSRRSQIHVEIRNEDTQFLFWQYIKSDLVRSVGWL